VWLKDSQTNGLLYPNRNLVLHDKPLIVVEGEFDALLLGQELIGLAPVVTFGSAGTDPSRKSLLAMVKASPWIIACEDDPAGRRSAESWLMEYEARCERVAPPPGWGKDWTDAHRNGHDLRSFWVRTLKSIARRRGGPQPPPPGATSALPAAIGARSDKPGLSVSRYYWRAEKLKWPPSRQDEWASLTAAYEDQGMAPLKAEERAFLDLSKGVWPG
jgi:hypothetical protein